MNPGGTPKNTYGRGPTTGNQTLGGKRGEFMASKAELQSLASTIVSEAAGKAVRLGTSPDAGGIHANVKGSRGPTKGNK